MLAYINYIHSRHLLLFANSLAREKQAQIRQYNLDNIYDVILAAKPEVLLMEESDLDNLHVKNFFTDLESDMVSLGQTKIIILYQTTSTKSLIQHSNIKYISEKLYLPYNEYFVPSSNTDSKYMLCHLNCIDFDLNKELEQIIYPNNKTIPVKLVNCPQVSHIQNLGMVDENAMLKLLSECYIYINIDNQYVYDAMMMNKPIINLIANNHLELTTSPIDIDQTNASYSVSSLKQHKISNLIKHLI